MANNLDTIAAAIHRDAADEVHDLLTVLKPRNLTGLEVAGILVILRGAMARNYPAGRDHAASVLELVRR